MKLGGLLVLVATFLIFEGIWQFVWIDIHRKGYLREKEEGETFYDWLNRYYKGELFWEMQNTFSLRWYYNSNIYKIFKRTVGLISLLLGIAIFVGIYFLSKTQYIVWLNIEF